MNWMAITGVRMLVTMVVMFCAVCSAAVLYLCGMPDKAVSSLVMAALVSWFVRPSAEECAAFVQFQQKRMEDRP